MFHEWFSTFPDQSSIDLSMVLSPELVAVYLLYLLRSVSESEYKSVVWDVYEEGKQALWVPEGWARPKLPFVEKL